MIYLLKAIKLVGYDSYDSHVVIANSEAEAREMVPCGDEAWAPLKSGEREEDRRERMQAWWQDPKNVTCVAVGVGCGTYGKPQVLCSSFNAG